MMLADTTQVTSNVDDFTRRNESVKDIESFDEFLENTIT